MKYRQASPCPAMLSRGRAKHMSDEKKTTTRRFLRRTAIYGGVFLLSFAATVYWSFPYSSITNRMVGEVEQALGISLEMSSISPYRGLGIRARDVIAISGDEEGKEQRVVFDVVTARLRLLETLISGPSVAFDVRSELGRVRGRANQTRDAILGIDMEIEGLSLGRIPGLSESIGIGLIGEASGAVTMSMPSGRIEDLSGTFDVRIDGAGLGGGMVGGSAGSRSSSARTSRGAPGSVMEMLRGATVPPIDFGDIEPRIVAEAGSIRLEPPLEIASADLDAQVTGTLELRENISTSRADMTFRLRPTDRFWEENQMLAGLAQAIMRQAEQSDGFYAYHLHGALSRPTLRPAR